MSYCMHSQVITLNNEIKTVENAVLLSWTKSTPYPIFLVYTEENQFAGFLAGTRKKDIKLLMHDLSLILDANYLHTQ